MNNAKLMGALGLCMRAGGMACGDFAAEKTIKAGKAALILLDAAASENTRQRYEGYAARNGLPLQCVEGLGKAIGRPDGRIAAVTDERFINMILTAMEL